MNGASFVNSPQGYWAEFIFYRYRISVLRVPLLGLSFYLATMDFKSSNDLEFGMAVINVLPSDGKVIDEGPVGCSVDVCCDDFRHLDIGLPPEILRLKDAGYLTQAVAACDRLLEQNPEPSLAACVRAERYRMLETSLHFSVSRDRAIAMIREEWPEFTEEQFDDLINRKRIDWRFIDGELFVLDNFLDSLRVYPKEVPGLRPDSTDGIALRNQMLREMESQNGLTRVITLKASVSVPGALEGEAVRAWLPVAAACRQQSHIEVLDMTSGGTVASEKRFGSYCLLDVFDGTFILGDLSLSHRCRLLRYLWWRAPIAYVHGHATARGHFRGPSAHCVYAVPATVDGACC